MEEPQKTLQADEEVTLVVSGEEATLVSPRFDDEETLVARPVVPLDEEAVEEPSAVAAAPLAPLPTRARRSYAPRRSWVLALVLVSVLVGGVLGGAGLYLYQRQSQDDGGVTTQAETPAETQQPATATTENAPTPEAQAPAESPAADAPTAEAQTVDTQPAEPAADDSAADVGTADDSTAAAAPAREPKATPAVERRDGADAGGSNSTRKRGKKGEHDDDDGDRSGRRRSRPDADVPVARDDAGAREARRVDSIVYRPRRAARRERIRRDTAGDTDRLRRIFEGTPE